MFSSTCLNLRIRRRGRKSRRIKKMRKGKEKKERRRRQLESFRVYDGSYVERM